MGATCRLTEFILVLEIEEFRLPKFALKVLQALKVWAKMTKVGKSTKPLRQDSNLHTQEVYSSDPTTITNAPWGLLVYSNDSFIY